MKRIQRLLSSNTVQKDDVLYFSFKKHVFTGKITDGGFIWKCTWQKPNQSPEIAFPNIPGRTFESLTDWTETCIQELLDEYHTRYSSWKRVRHQRLHDRPMESIYKEFQFHNASNQAEVKPVVLYEQLIRRQHIVDELTTKLNLWEEWFKEHHPDKPLPITLQATQKEEKDIPETGVQPFTLTSDTGQYMVLHRVNEIAPEKVVSWLKQNGPQHFVEKFLEKNNVIFDPASSGVDNWAQPDQAEAKRFIHNFFKK